MSTNQRSYTTKLLVAFTSHKYTYFDSPVWTNRYGLLIWIIDSESDQLHRRSRSIVYVFNIFTQWKACSIVINKNVLLKDSNIRNHYDSETIEIQVVQQKLVLSYCLKASLFGYEWYHYTNQNFSKANSQITPLICTLCVHNRDHTTIKVWPLELFSFPPFVFILCIAQ